MEEKGGNIRRRKTRVIMHTGINNGIESRNSHEKTRVFIDTEMCNGRKRRKYQGGKIEL